MKKVLLCFLSALLLTIPAFSQSADQISKILDSQKATFAQVSYLPALYANLINENDSEEASFEAIKKAGWVPESAKAESEVTLSQLSLIYAKAIGLSGGLFYSLFHNERYAFKELKARRILPGDADPSTKLSGRESIDLFNSCLTQSKESK